MTDTLTPQAGHKHAHKTRVPLIQRSRTITLGSEKIINEDDDEGYNDERLSDENANEEDVLCFPTLLMQVNIWTTWSPEKLSVPIKVTTEKILSDTFRTPNATQDQAHVIEPRSLLQSHALYSR